MIVYKIRVTREYEVYQEEEDTGTAIMSAVNDEASNAVMQLQAIVLGKETVLQ